MRYTGPKLKILRRLKVKSLPALTTNKQWIREKPMGRRKIRLFWLRLKEKQKLRYNFGVRNHKFFNYVKRAKKTPGSTGEILLKLLEMRFDNIIFRLKLAPTINAAKQLIIHGHFLINKKKVDIPSYECKVKDEISIRPKSKDFINKLVKDNKKIRRYQIPKHLKFDKKNLIGNISREISLKDPVIQSYYYQLELKILYVIEFFSRQL